MTFDKRQSSKANIYTYDLQINHKRYLDVLKQDFVKNYSNPIIYSKSVNDFDLIQALGCGSFGTVFLVRDKVTFVYYAMKAIEKSNVIKKKCLKQVLLEKRILQSVNFAFVITLDFCCKDNLYIYFLLSYEGGGELFALIRKLGSLSESLTHFYTAQIVLALEYLHHCSIIHRDVKPENILINESGYIKLADFGFSKIVKSRTWTICGTPEYLAPEIVMSKGYSYPVDWWALGVLIYEMNAGYPPFYSSDTMKLYEKVFAGQFKTPDTMTPQCKSLVKGLLEVDPTKRLGSLKTGVYDIKGHPWFNDTNWDAILHHKMLPPFIPIFKNPGDTGNFRKVDDFILKRADQCLFEKEFENF
ncbi:cAMP-dependent protein kinase catalytic subunit alpha-like [Galleria mellonella]|uniref:cAMP-dependent protein kinase n=1 Tax=Galleria mellonella TaxID=7137 RepID=A0A6J1X5K9_GALME|nr:cAMP-dependent protein kinase catalytic subunit alpha-like [Galleria mellonella]